MSPARGTAEPPLYDAHCHVFDERLAGALSDLPSADRIAAHVVNGTHPGDWPLVRDFPGLGLARPLKAYGVHPWKVDHLPDDWEARLREFLALDGIGIGEIGLDRWIEPRDEDRQLEVFLRQLDLASELDLPPTIHCVRAWGLLLDCLRAGPPLERGFLVHGFSGSVETLREILDLGGYVSFSAYGGHPGRQRIREAARACPADRILIETDAPDMVPPEEVCQFKLADAQGNRLHHPAELITAYGLVAQWRGIEAGILAEQVRLNFTRLFAT